MRVQTAAVTLVGATLGQPEDCSAVIGCHMHQLNYQTVVEKEKESGEKCHCSKRKSKQNKTPPTYTLQVGTPFCLFFLHYI